MARSMYSMYFNVPFSGVSGINLFCSRLRPANRAMEANLSIFQAKGALQNILYSLEMPFSSTFKYIGFIKCDYSYLINVLNVLECSKVVISAILPWRKSSYFRGWREVFGWVPMYLRSTSKYIDSDKTCLNYEVGESDCRIGVHVTYSNDSR